MKKITLILPYFGTKFPSIFPVLLDSMGNNRDVNFIVPTNINTDGFDTFNNIKIIPTTLSTISSKIIKLVGYKVKLDKPYKLCDFRPLYGLLFDEFLTDSDWWGYFDSDMIFGNISNFVIQEMLDEYDRIFTHGHLTMFKNNNKNNYLWNKDFKVKGVPKFKTVATHSANFGFDEWGWGPNKGRGLSYALDKSNLVHQFDDNRMFADILADRSSFDTTAGLKIKSFEYSRGKLIGTDYENVNHEFLYVHLQKRNMEMVGLSSFEHIFIYPNQLLNDKSKMLNPNDEKNRWEKNYRLQRKKQIKNNLSISYFIRRAMFLFAE